VFADGDMAGTSACYDPAHTGACNSRGAPLVGPWFFRLKFPHTQTGKKVLWAVVRAKDSLIRHGAMVSADYDAFDILLRRRA